MNTTINKRTSQVVNEMDPTMARDTTVPEKNQSLTDSKRSQAWKTDPGKLGLRWETSARGTCGAKQACSATRVCGGHGVGFEKINPPKRGPRLSWSDDQQGASDAPDWLQVGIEKEEPTSVGDETSTLGTHTTVNCRMS